MTEFEINADDLRNVALSIDKLIKVLRLVEWPVAYYGEYNRCNPNRELEKCSSLMEPIVEKIKNFEENKKFRRF